MYLGTSVILITLLGQVLADEEQLCTTPNGENGECIPLVDCEDLFESFANPKEGEENELEKYICTDNTYSNALHVCCSFKDRIITMIETEDFATLSQLSNRSYCGVHPTTNISDDTSVGVADFPWLATIILEKSSSADPQVKCGGVLINTKYILTTASCVGDEESFNTNLHLVRLGHLNLDNEKECVRLFNESDCMKYVEYGIEKTVPHSFYYKPTALNDIALIKLNRAVVFSNYIRPVCLPMPGSTPVQLGNTLTATALSSLNTISTKKKIKTELLANLDCEKRFDDVCQNCSKTAIALNINQFCTRDTDDNEVSACTYDRGSPTMFLHENQWHVLGIIFLPVCDRTKPVLNTKVSKYLRWIARNVKL